MIRLFINFHVFLVGVMMMDNNFQDKYLWRVVLGGVGSWGGMHVMWVL